MTRKLLVGVALALGLMTGSAWAADDVDCPSGSRLRPINGAFAPGANSTLVSAQGRDVRLISFTPTGSAGTFTLYDAATINGGDVIPAKIVYEGGAAASDGKTFPPNGLFPVPIRFQTGIVAHGANVSGLVVYACSP